MLSTVAVDESCPDQWCLNRSCDNCKMSRSDKHQPVNKMIVDLIKRVGAIELCPNDTSSFFRAAVSLLKSYSTEDNFLMCGLVYYPKIRSESLLDYLLRQTGNQHWEDWQDRIESSGVSFFLRSKTMPKQLKLEERTPIYHDTKLIVASKVPDKNMFRPKVRFSQHLPYLIQFELKRFKMSNSSDTEFYKELQRRCEQNVISAWRYLYQKKQKRAMPLQNAVEEWKQCPEKMNMFFRCSLSAKGTIGELGEPDYAFGRRMYRYYRSDRFLEISVDRNTPFDIIKKVFSNIIVFCGRRFRFMWAKVNKSPQKYICFAESGVGLCRKEDRSATTSESGVGFRLDEECSVAELMERCIPKSLNPFLTISQFFKRMKLWFSTTVEGPVLNNGSVVTLSDFGSTQTNTQINEIDGAGLVSPALLELIKIEYNKNCKKSRGDSELLPYTGFQGRIGG